MKLWRRKNLFIFSTLLIFSLNICPRMIVPDIGEGDSSLYNALDHPITVNLYQGCRDEKPSINIITLQPQETYSFFFKPKDLYFDQCDYQVAITVFGKNKQLLIPKTPIHQGRYFITYTSIDKRFEVIEVAY